MSLGGQATYAVSYSWGVLVPQASLEYVHEFDDDSRNIDGQFVGDPSGTTFSLPTDSADQNYFNIGLGTSAIFTQGRSAFLFYRGVLGYEDVSQHSISAGVRMEF